MSRYLCLCDGEVDDQTKLPRKSGAPNLQRLADLYFCPRCHALKCPNCCSVAVECKFCPSCMTDYSDHAGLTRCTKNCFQCPECRSPLDIEIHDLEVDACKGKKFTFGCVYCTYTYQTRFISKPASLTTILKQERPSYFSQLHAKYSLRHKLYAEDEGATPKRASGADPKQHISPDEALRMQKLNINPTKVMDDRDSLVYRMAQIEARPVDIDADFRPVSMVKLPLGNHLAAKKSYSCSACEAKLCVPVADARSMKYLKKEVAPEVVPNVTVKRQGTKAKEAAGSSTKKPKSRPSAEDVSALEDEESDVVSCVLSVINPLTVTMNVTVSTLASVPSHLEDLSANSAPSVALPVTSFTVGPRHEKAKVLDAMPSVYLTDRTAASRAEKLTRAIRKESENGLVEKGFNWVSVPLNILEQKHVSEETRVCLYVTVETRAPDAWVLAEKSKRSVKYGFWVVCKVEE